jgi:hypothetical protein
MVVLCGVCMCMGEGGGGGKLTPLPENVLQGERSAQIRGIRDILRRRRPEDLPQHRPDGDGRLVKPSEGVRGCRSHREEPTPGRGGRLVVVGRH